jgi:hypothetical protein
MKTTHLIASLVIIGCTTAAWFLLGTTIAKRTWQSSTALHAEVAGVWGPELVQEHPHAWFETPNAPGGRARVLPSSSVVEVGLDYDPKQRGLLWHRTYDARFAATYVFTNPTRIPQTFYLAFPLPKETAGLHGFEFALDPDNGGASAATPAHSGVVTRAVTLPADGSVTLRTAYRTRGTNSWKYHFPDRSRVSGFQLTMRTDFPEVNYPVGTGSPGPRKEEAGGFTLAWQYPDVLGAPDIGMDMPKQLNAGPVASRIAFFAPVSLLFFVTVILLLAAMKGIPLHPMHVFFVAAGFFAFHLMFAYLVDLVPLAAAFAIAAVVSLVLVCGYLRAVGGGALFRIAVPAQSVYLIAFSASFFIDGLTGIMLTSLAVLTLAMLMFVTARIDWTSLPSRRLNPVRAEA